MHIYIRGVAEQIIFENRNDYIYSLNLLKRFSEETQVVICAFCLMENHVHLIVYDEGHNVSRFMHLLGMTYATYFNHKYDRSGHLFICRFFRVPIESEEYMLTVFRYALYRTFPPETVPLTRNHHIHSTMCYDKVTAAKALELHKESDTN